MTNQHTCYYHLVGLMNNFFLYLYSYLYSNENKIFYYNSFTILKPFHFNTISYILSLRNTSSSSVLLFHPSRYSHVHDRILTGDATGDRNTSDYHRPSAGHCVSICHSELKYVWWWNKNAFKRSFSTKPLSSLNMCFCDFIVKHMGKHVLIERLTSMIRCTRHVCKQCIMGLCLFHRKHCAN